MNSMNSTAVHLAEMQRTDRERDQVSALMGRLGLEASSTTPTTTQDMWRKQSDELGFFAERAVSKNGELRLSGVRIVHSPDFVGVGVRHLLPTVQRKTTFGPGQTIPGPGTQT